MPCFQIVGFCGTCVRNDNIKYTDCEGTISLGPGILSGPPRRDSGHRRAPTSNDRSHGWHAAGPLDDPFDMCATWPGNPSAARRRSRWCHHSLTHAQLSASTSLSWSFMIA